MSTKIHPSDYKYVPVDPEPGFSPEKNKAIVEGTIKKYEAMRRKKFQEFRDNLAERTDAITSWVTSLNKSTKPIDQYLGRRWMTYFAGERIMQKLNKIREIREKYNKWIV